MRRLTAGERALARSVFGDGLKLDGMRIGQAPFGDFAVALGDCLLFPRPPPEDFSVESVERRAWLVHEMTHAWQFQTAATWTIGSWARTLLTGGYGPGSPGYAYAHPVIWDRLNLEQQARVVENAYVLREGRNAEDPASALAAYAGRTPFEALTRTA